VTLVPVAYLFFISLQKVSIYRPGEYVFRGFQNYLNVLSAKDTWQAMLFTFRFTFCSVLIELVLGFAVALLFNRRNAGAGLKTARASLIMPMVIAPILASVTWKMAMDSNGILNFLLRLLGIAPVRWLTDTALVPWSVVLVDVWQWTPYMFFVITSGLQSLSETYYEAARIDGANARQTFLHITLPLMRKVLLVGAIFRTMGAFRAYDSIYGLTGGGPGNITSNASLYAYKLAFKFDLIGESAALCILLLVVIMAVCVNISGFMGEIWENKAS
jgi:multiple sugar transport system permease protein